MIRNLVRSIIHDARVTRAGGAALRIDPFILRTAEILPFEELEVINAATGAHVRTWAEPGVEGSGEIEVPGGARAGDTITIVCYAQLHEGQTLDHKPRVVRLDAKNQVLSAM
jgi:aspartate 1-decarboxylase